MISSQSHIWNEIYHLNVNALPHYLRKTCAVNINIYVYFHNKMQSSLWKLSKPVVAQNRSYTWSL